MRNAIILHGMIRKAEYYDPERRSLSNMHWLPWLQAQLLKYDIAAVTPEVPFAYKADWDQWVKEVERYEIGPETILVGHSAGGGFWVRYLSEHPALKVGKVVLVAPWIDPTKTLKSGLFDFEIDPHLARRTRGVTIFSSDNDAGNVLNSIAELREKVKDIGYREFKGYKHFNYGAMGTEEFPELLQHLV